MAETVDTRVVEAKFDSKQFEQGVDKTVKKLDELKKSLSLANTGKTVAEIGDKISETTDKATNSLQKLENRLTSFTGMLKQKLISGIADEIVGVFFKIKSSFENMVKSLSTAQIGVGMQRYTDILTSVRTLTAAGVQQDKAYEAIERLGLYADQTSYSLDSMVATMSKLKTAGADVDTATRMVEGLSNAAASMGVNAQQAERAYLNLQQAYSKKVMLQNDWMSFESIPMVGSNFNKAILKAAEKVGTLQAEKVDKKTGEVLSYKTKKKAGTKVRSAKGITADNMGSMLNSRWFTDEVMEEVFGNTYYFNEIGIDEVNKLKEQENKIRSEVQKMVDKGELDGSKFEETVSNKLQEYFDETNKEKIEAKKKEIDLRKETAKQELEAKKLTKQEYDNLIKELDKEMQNFEAENTLTAFAYEAFRAGQEARSFTDVINTLKDAISRGWAKSFELIFGKLDEAADFFTKLTESNFAEFIYSIGEFRNAVLESWRTHGGRDNMIGVLEYLDELAGDINKQLGLVRDAEEWFEANFDSQLYTQLLRSEGKGAAEEYKESVKKESEKSPFASIAEDLGLRLAIAGRDIKDFFESVRKWFTEADTKGVSRLQRISNIIDGFGKIFNGTMTAVGMGLEFVGKMYNTFKPVFDSLWAAFEKVLTPIFNAFDPKNIRQDGMQPYKMLSNTLDNIAKVAEKVAEPLAKVIDILGDVGAFFVNLAVDSFLSNMQFFTDAFALLLEILGIGSAQQDQGAGVLDGIRKGFEEFGETVKTWGTAISDFFSSIIADIRTWLGLNGDAKNTSSGNIFENITKWWNSNEALQNVKKGLDDFIANVGEWIKNLPKNIAQFAIDIGDFFKSLFYHKETVTNGTTTETKWIENDITLWVKQAVKDIKEWFADIPSRIKEFGIDISDFFHNLFYTKKHDIITTPKGISKMISWEVETPFKQWLDQAILDVKAFIKSIPEKIAKIPSLIKEFFKNIFYTKKKVEFTTPKGIEKTAYVYVKTPLKEWLDKAILNVKEFIKSIPSKIAKIPSLIGEFFHGLFYKKETINTGSGTEEKEIATPLKEWIDGAIKDVSTWVSSIDISGILNGIKDIGRDIVNGIISIFSGKTEWEENKNWLSERIASAIDNIRTRAEQIWPRVSEWFVDLPNKIVRFFSGEDGTKNESTPIGTAFNNFIKSIGEWLSSIPSTLLGFWKNAEAGIDSLWNKVISAITGSPRKKEVLKPNSKYYDLNKMLEEDRAAGNTPSNKILSNISSFFTDLVDYIWKKIQAIPGNIKSLWDKAVTIGTIVWEVITGNNKNEFGEPKNYGNDLYNNIETFVQTVSDWIGERIQDLGVLLRENWTKVKKIGTIIWETITGDNKTATGDIKDYGEGYNNAAKVIDNIVTWIKNQILLIPSRIVTGINFVSDLIEALFNPEAAQRKAYLKNLSKSRYNNKTVSSEDLISLAGYGSKKEIEKASEGAQEFLQNYLNVGKWSKAVNPDIVGVASEATMDSLNSSNGDISDQNLKKTSFFEELWNNIVKMFEDIGPAILEGLQKAFEWIGEKLTKATNFLGDLHKEGHNLYDIVFGDYQDTDENGVVNPVFTTIKEFGKTIYTMITQTIPNFISAAATDIWDMVPQIISGITGINIGGKEEVPKEVENVAAEVGKETGKTISKAYSQAYYEQLLNEDPTGYSAEMYKRSFQKLFDPEEDFSKPKEANKPRNWFLELAGISTSYADEIEGATAALNAEADAIDAAKKNADKKENLVNRQEEIARLENELNKIYENEDFENIRVKVQSGADLTEEEYGIFEPLRNREKEIQEMLNVLKKSKDEYVDMNKIFNKSTENKTEETTGGITSFLTGFGDVAQTIVNIVGSDTGQAIIKILAITYLLETIKDMFSISDNISEIFSSAKGLVLSAVFAGITAILGYVIYLASMDPGGTAFKNVEKIFGYLTEIAKWVGIFAIAWKGGNVLTDFIGLFKDTPKKAGQVNIIEESMSNGFDVLNKLLDMGNTLLKPFEIATIGEAVTSVVSKIGASLADIGASLGQAIDLLMTYISPAIEKVNRVGSSISQALGIIPDIKTFIASFLETFIYTQWKIYDSKESNQSLIDVTGDQFNKTLSYLDDNMSLIYAVSVIAGELANALGSFNKIEDLKDKIPEVTRLFADENGETGFKNMFATLIISLHSVFSDPRIGNILSTDSDVSKVDNFSRYVHLMADALSVFGTSINGISSESIGGLTNVFGLIQEFMESADANLSLNHSNRVWTDLLLGDTSLKGFATQLSLFASHMVSVFTHLDSIRKIVDTNKNDIITIEDEYQSFSNVIGLVSQFAQKMTEIESIHYLLGTDDLGKAKQRAEMMNTTLPLIGTAIMETMTSMNNLEGIGDIDFKPIFSGIDAVSKITEALTSKAGTYYSNTDERMNKIADGLFGEDNKSGFLFRLSQASQEWVKSGVNNFEGVDEFIDMLYKLSTALEIFYSTDALGNYQYETGLQNLMTIEWDKILADKDNLTAPEITPVLTITPEFEKNAAKMRNMLGFTEGEDGKWVLSPDLNIAEGLQIPEPKDYTYELKMIEDRMDRLVSISDNFENALSRMSFVIPAESLTATIGPSMDKWLGSEATFVVRANVNNGG